MKKLKKGDRVLVWSLQSFNCGGFLKGEPAFVRQDQSGSSVLLCVIRNFKGHYEIDKSYEVYDKQVKPVRRAEWNAEKRLRRYRKEIMKDKYI
jgi:hypothetical protein